MKSEFRFAVTPDLSPKSGNSRLAALGQYGATNAPGRQIFFTRQTKLHPLLGERSGVRASIRHQQNCSGYAPDLPVGNYCE